MSSVRGASRSSTPWFDTELNALGRGYYESAAFEVYSAPAAASGQADHALRPTRLGQ